MPFITDKLASQQELTSDYQQPSQTDSASKQKRLSRYTFDLAAIASLLTENLIGQKSAINQIIELLTIIKADIGLPHQPLATCLLVGSTGVGKTETVRLLAKAIYGDSNRICRIDMNTLSQSHYAAALTGAPPGYVGSKEGHTLFNQELIEGSYSKPGLVLLDEIEKASDEVLQSLLNVMDNGFLQLTAGQKNIDFRNSLIFMTSNLGIKELHQAQAHRPSLSFLNRISSRKKHSTEKQKQIFNQSLEDKFSPEFINRIDQIVHYQTIDDEGLNDLIHCQIVRLNQRLKTKGVQVRVSDQAIDCLKLNYDQRYGARDMARNIRREIEAPLAQALLNDSEAQVFTVIAVNNGIAVKPLHFTNESPTDS